ncbi:hypothetical protein RFI_21064 [Reticulomyxa filosa]|uniref:J domain-containing protein n=1 Tax=Reticulomyxa filosa TaxID=46433 RepID=X6MS54_RETFI|nr:hypothetical protein RFI_21064 [Reticulomyxa filosa]|eukprot:ETO16292.1 hypothetical protein RFI_21064 [Reticulomyxa filosa]
MLSSILEKIKNLKMHVYGYALIAEIEINDVLYTIYLRTKFSFTSKNHIDYNGNTISVFVDKVNLPSNSEAIKSILSGIGISFSKNNQPYIDSSSKSFINCDNLDFDEPYIGECAPIHLPASAEADAISFRERFYGLLQKSQTCYDYMRVKPSATIKEIKAVYQAFAKFYHPDLAPSINREFNANELKLINQAYTSCFIDGQPVKDQYDNYLKASVQLSNYHKSLFERFQELKPFSVKSIKDLLKNPNTIYMAEVKISSLQYSVYYAKLVGLPPELSELNGKNSANIYQNENKHLIIVNRLLAFSTAEDLKRHIENLHVVRKSGEIVIGGRRTTFDCKNMDFNLLIGRGVCVGKRELEGALVARLRNLEVRKSIVIAVGKYNDVEYEIKYTKIKTGSEDVIVDEIGHTFTINKVYIPDNSKELKKDLKKQIKGWTISCDDVNFDAGNNATENKCIIQKKQKETSKLPTSLPSDEPVQPTSVWNEAPNPLGLPISLPSDEPVQPTSVWSEAPNPLGLPISLPTDEPVQLNNLDIKPKISLLIRFLEQNQGKFSQRAKIKIFQDIDENELNILEEVYYKFILYPKTKSSNNHA